MEFDDSDNEIAQQYTLSEEGIVLLREYTGYASCSDSSGQVYITENRQNEELGENQKLDELKE